MSCFKLIGVSYQNLEHPFIYPRVSISDTFRHITERVGIQFQDMLTHISEGETLEIKEHFLCSTIITSCFATGDITWPQVRTYFKQNGSHHSPTILLNAYECASWGYALRYCFKKHPSIRYVMVSICDVNVYNLEHWVYNPLWGHSGFGCTTMLIEREGEGDISTELVTGGIQHYNLMIGFASVVRKAIATRDKCAISLPFFPKPIRNMLERALNQYTILANGHEQWGHCFGSDPWISILNHSLKNSATSNINYLACSLALNGYYSLLEIEVTPKTVFLLHENIPRRERRIGNSQ